MPPRAFAYRLSAIPAIPASDNDDSPASGVAAVTPWDEPAPQSTVLPHDATPRTMRAPSAPDQGVPGLLPQRDPSSSYVRLRDLLEQAPEAPEAPAPASEPAPSA